MQHVVVCADRSLWPVRTVLSSSVLLEQELNVYWLQPFCRRERIFHHGCDAMGPSSCCLHHLWVTIQCPVQMLRQPDSGMAFREQVVTNNTAAASSPERFIASHTHCDRRQRGWTQHATFSPRPSMHALVLYQTLNPTHYTLLNVTALGAPRRGVAVCCGWLWTPVVSHNQCCLHAQNCRNSMHSNFPNACPETFSSWLHRSSGNPVAPACMQRHVSTTLHCYASTLSSSLILSKVCIRQQSDRMLCRASYNGFLGFSKHVHAPDLRV